MNGAAEIELAVPCGTNAGGGNSVKSSSSRFIKTNYQEDLLAELIQTYAVSDFCLIGE